MPERVEPVPWPLRRSEPGKRFSVTLLRSFDESALTVIFGH